jgi:3-hydroxyacyl-CoA dehydrogenase/enoyl-CoA hydratase/3-hydroxybutyryl-CoA epimerase
MITTQQNGANVSVRLAARSINPLSRLFQRDGALLGQLESRRPTLLRSSSASTPNRPATILTRSPDGADASASGRCMHMLDAYNALLRRLENLGVPVLATLGGEISGHAFGTGAGLPSPHRPAGRAFQPAAGAAGTGAGGR